RRRLGSRDTHRLRHLPAAAGATGRPVPFRDAGGRVHRCGGPRAGVVTRRIAVPGPPRSTRRRRRGPAIRVTYSWRVRVALGVDHRGFLIKDELVAFLKEEGHDVVDCGTDSTDSVDYPDTAADVSR